MDLWQLHIFCKVVELKSFSKAGEAVHLTQPTVSSHIKDLEAHFSTQLIDRLSREVFPTKAGELLYEYAYRLLALRDKTESAMAEFTGKMKGHVCVGGSTIPGGYLLPRVIGLFSNAFPEVRVSLLVGDTSEILAKTSAGRIEIGIVGAIGKDKMLNQTPLFSDEMGLVVPSSHKWAHRSQVKIEELTKEPFIIRETGSGTLKAIEQSLKKKHLNIEDLSIVAVMGSTEAVRQAIKSKAGISILSALAISDERKLGQLRILKIEGLNLKRQFYLTTHKHRSLSPPCQAFIAFLKKDIKDHPPFKKH